MTLSAHATIKQSCSAVSTGAASMLQWENHTAHLHSKPLRKQQLINISDIAFSTAANNAAGQLLKCSHCIPSSIGPQQVTKRTYAAASGGGSQYKAAF